VPHSGPSTPSRAPPLSVGARDDPAMIRDMLLANPDQLALLQQNNPALADAVLSGSLGENKIIRLACKVFMFH
jgi:DNA damage-inducible protein 1